MILAKILLESRALNVSENKAMIERLLALITKSEQDEVRAIIGSEVLNYHLIADAQDRVDKIWTLSEAIRQEKLLEIAYTSHYTGQMKTYSILPVSLYFDNFYFYLDVYIVKYKEHRTLRVDHISRLVETLEKKPTISYGEKYRDGDERIYRVDAFSGMKRQVKIEYYSVPQFVLDRFPDAKNTAQIDGRSLIEFAAEDTAGLTRWLLGQGNSLKVLEPLSLVEKMKAEIENLRRKYQ